LEEGKKSKSFYIGMDDGNSNKMREKRANNKEKVMKNGVNERSA